MSQQTGRYRFRRGWLGVRILQAEWMGEDRLWWQDVDRKRLQPALVFAIVRPSEWLRFAEAEKLRERVELAERRAEIARNSRARRRQPAEFEQSRLS